MILRRVACGSLLALPLLACAREPRRSPPRADFLVVTGDSTFWAQVQRGRSTLRSSTLLLAELDGRFHEIYVTDDDRSYYDAVIVGQRVYRRDIISGDSALMFEDSAVARIAREYAAEHPGERPLSPDDEASDDPANVATTDTEIIDVVGPYASVLRHLVIDLESGEEIHTTRHMVLDLRTGRVATVADLVPDSAIGRVLREAHAGFGQVRDSVRRAAAVGGEEAVSASLLPYFSFDSSSFSLMVQDGRPALAFVAPGTGPDAGEMALPVQPIAISAGDWWREVSATLPSASTDEADEWDGAAAYGIVVEYDTALGSAALDRAALSVRDSVGELWPLGTLPLPVLRVHRLDSGGRDRRTAKALTRAFEEAARYSLELKTALAPRSPRSVLPVVRFSRSMVRD